MKKINITISIPEEIYQLLYTLVERRKIGIFVASALEKALEDKMENLKKEYIEAENDPDRQETINDWKALEGEDWND